MRNFCVLRTLFKKHDLEEKRFFKKHDFGEKFFCKKHDFDRQNFRLVGFKINFYNASDFKSTIFSTRQILNQLFKHASDFDLNIFPARQILSVLLLQFGKFSSVHHKKPRFRNVLRYGVGSVSQGILLG